ncbi:MAG: NAD-dependent epimerase/dehydratase family protein [Acidobacteriota bacterium]
MQQERTKHALVTGAAGFIGSHLVDRLLRDGWTVTGLDNFDPFYSRAAKENNIVGHRNTRGYRFIEADIRDSDSLESLAPEKYDAVVHLAAKAGVRPSIMDPIAYQEVNVRGTQNLLELARKWEIPHFVFGSSSSVYGVNPRVPWSEEDAVLLPISPYASTKISGELLGHVYSHLFGIRFCALRFFTVYGPRQRPDLAIHKFARLIVAGQPIPFFGDGSSGRDYTFVGDIVGGICAALDYRALPYSVFNLGNNRVITLTEMVTTLEDVLGKKAIRDFQPPQSGDVPQTWADISKAARVLGYSPSTSFHSGVTEFAAWLRQSSDVTGALLPTR